MSGDRLDHGPWRNLSGSRRLVEVRQGESGVYELTVYPGADVLDPVGATARLPKVAFVDHRRAAPGDASVVLVFRELPSATPDALAVGPPSTTNCRAGTAPAWAAAPKIEELAPFWLENGFGTQRVLGPHPRVPSRRFPDS